MKLHFLYATETGNAEMLCDDICDSLDDEFETEVSSLADMTPGDLDAGTFYIIVSSTYGSGDVPSAAAPFSDALEADKPDLKGVRFAIFGLGDMVFGETFAQGSQTLMEQMIACRAELIGERGIHDASGFDMPEDIGLPWFQGVLALLREKTLVE